MDNEFNDILNECLERLLVKGETIEHCLQSYPEQADELRPLLQTALAVKKASTIQPRAEFKARARYRFHSALQEAASRRSRPLFGWFPRWATVVAIVLGLLLLGSGTVAQASYSMPDSPLYPLKIATENVQLALTPSDLGKAELDARFADRRVLEIIYLANKGDARRIEAVTQRLDKRLAMLASFAPTQEAAEQPKVMMAPTIAPTPVPAPTPSPEEGPVLERGGGARARLNKQARLRMTVEQYAANHPAALRAALDRAPESAKPALRRAIAIAEERYQKAIEALE